MHKVFISYHHWNDWQYKEKLIQIGRDFSAFIDKSVDTGDISEGMSDQAVREKIRDEYLQDSTVTILLVGLETKKRKHIDWEIYSSMFDGARNKKSGILVINLPSTGCGYYWAAHGEEEKQTMYPGASWEYIDSRAGFESQYPYLPDRIIDNLLAPKAKISVVPWNKLTVEGLKLLIDLTYRDRASCEYDFSRQMRRHNA